LERVLTWWPLWAPIAAVLVSWAVVALVRAKAGRSAGGE